MITTLPNPKDVRDLLTDLLGRDVDVRVTDAWLPTGGEYACAAEFVDDHLSLEAVVLLSLPLAVFTGASIGLVPAGGAKDMVAEKSPSTMVVGNLYEVLNILTSVFNTPDNPHVRIATMHAPGDTFPPDVAQLSRKPAGRIDLTVSIAGYGDGHLALISA